MELELSSFARTKTHAFHLIPEPEIFVAKLFVIDPYPLHFLKTPHPAFAKTEGTGANDPASATRKLTLASGGTIEEKLNKYDAAAKSMSYEITNVDVKVVPVTNYTSTLSVSGAGDKSTVEWKGAFYRGYVNNDPPPELSDEAAVAAITGVFKSGLAALKAKIETPAK